MLNNWYQGILTTCSCICRCYHECINGKCGTNYECNCYLGWTGPDCNTDCQCNNQSMCSKGVGLCDRCHHNTGGTYCQLCLPGYYGKPSQGKTYCCTVLYSYSYLILFNPFDAMICRNFHFTLDPSWICTDIEIQFIFLVYFVVVFFPPVLIICLVKPNFYEVLFITGLPNRCTEIVMIS